MSRMTSWGGAPMPWCVCGHDEIHHFSLKPTPKPPGGWRPPQRCGAVVGTSWCKCSDYRPETDRVRATSSRLVNRDTAPLSGSFVEPSA